jgi:acetyltransferase
LRSGEAAIEALAGLAAVSEWQRAASSQPHAVQLASIPQVDDGQVATIDATDWLLAHGVSVAPAQLATDLQEAMRALEVLGPPVALKIESPDILHKTEAGGVQLGIQDGSSLRAAYEQMLQSVIAYAPTARIRGVVVQRMAHPGVECVIGLSQDPVFGPVVMVGLGGVWIEVLKDVTFARCPVSAQQAMDLIHTLRGVSLLKGFRGAPPADIQALADLVSQVSAIGAALGDRLGELDLNPVFVHAKGVTAVDVVFSLRRPGA